MSENDNLERVRDALDSAVDTFGHVADQAVKEAQKKREEQDRGPVRLLIMTYLLGNMKALEFSDEQINKAAKSADAIIDRALKDPPSDTKEGQRAEVE